MFGGKRDRFEIPTDRRRGHKNCVDEFFRGCGLQIA